MNYLAYQHTKKPLELSDISRPIFWLIISVFVVFLTMFTTGKAP